MNNYGRERKLVKRVTVCILEVAQLVVLCPLLVRQLLVLSKSMVQNCSNSVKLLEIFVDLNRFFFVPVPKLSFF